MRTTTILALAAAAGQAYPALAAPIDAPVVEERTLAALAPVAEGLVGKNLISGIASGLTGVFLTNKAKGKREVPMYVDTDTGIVYAPTAADETTSVTDKRALAAIGALAEGLVGKNLISGIASGLTATFLSTKKSKRDVPTYVDTETGVLYARTAEEETAGTTDKRALAALAPLVEGIVGKGLLRGIVSGLKLGSLAGKKSRRDVSMYIDTDTGIVYTQADNEAADSVKRDVPMYVDTNMGAVYAQVGEEAAEKRSFGTAFDIDDLE